MSDGIPVKLLAGARLATRIVPPRFPHCSRLLLTPKSAPRSSKVSNLRMYPRSHLTLWHTRMSSASRQQPVCPHIAHGTVRSICCLEPHSPRVECIHCPSRSARQWRSTSGRLSIKIHPNFHFTCRLQLLLRGKEGWRLEALHGLLRPELHK